MAENSIRTLLLSIAEKLDRARMHRDGDVSPEEAFIDAISEVAEAIRSTISEADSKRLRGEFALGLQSTADAYKEKAPE